MKKQLIFFLFSLISGVSLQNCKFAKIDSIANSSAEAGFTIINAKGRIIDYKDGTPTAHGHCYSTSVEIPEVGLADTDTTETPFVAVDFESKIDSLIFDKTYFVRPYMRNGTKIVYGEVQKISTKTPGIVIKNFLSKDTLIPPMGLPEQLISIDISTNEPLLVLPLPNNVASREYGFIFGKADTLRIDSGFPTNPNIFDIRFVSPNNVNNNVRNFRLNLRRASPLAPNNSAGVVFFNEPPSTNFAVRAYMKLNKDGVAKYYYTNRVAFRFN